MVRLRVAVLGRLSVEVDGAPKRLTPTAGAVLIRLVLAHGTFVTLDQLFRDVWRTGAGAAIRREDRVSVQKRISELRKVLDPSRPGDSSEVIETDRGRTSAYRLVLERDDVDLFRFKDAVDGARSAEPVARVKKLRDALALWRGAPLADVADYPFVANAVRQADVLNALAHRLLVEAHIGLDQVHEAYTTGSDFLAEQADEPSIRSLVDGLNGQAKTAPRALVRHEYPQPKMAVVVATGDLFSLPGADLVVGFSDTFDTSTRDDVVIARNSTQGQLLERLYGGDRARLDQDLRRALESAPKVGRETREAKRRGKLVRYPIGTVAVLREGRRSVFGVAYSRMSNDLIAQSTVERLTASLERVWDAVHRHGQFDLLAMPLVGSGRSRIGSADHQDLLALIVRSFVARSRIGPICRELQIVLAPSQVDKIDVPTVAALLAGL